jgi:hypothetical protein
MKTPKTMFKLVISLLTIFNVCTSFSHASCEKPSKQVLRKLPVKLGRLRIFDLIENQLINVYDTQQKQRDNLLKKLNDQKNEAMLEEEAKRRKIYAKHLLLAQGGSNVLRDFLTNLF